jgi:hypothetical protein
MIGSFGRDGMVGNPIDDLVNQVSAKLDSSASHLADVAYNEVHARFEQDKAQLAAEMVAEAKPRAQKAIYDIIDDPQTHERINTLVDDAVAEAQPKIMKSAAPLAVAMVLGTAAVTWAMVTFLKPGKKDG